MSRVRWKLSRTVLRGGADGNVGPPLDMKPPEGAKGPKTPYHFRLKNDDLFSLAGIWERWVRCDS